MESPQKKKKKKKKKNQKKIQRQQKVVQHGNNETDILTFLLQALQLSLTIETQFIQSQRCAKQMKRKRVPPQIKERMRELKHTIE
jgi:hypothetical protein